MVQSFLDALLAALPSPEAWLRALAVLALTLIVLLLLRLLDRPRYERLLNRAPGGARTGLWLLPALTLLAALPMYAILQRVVTARISTDVNARYLNRADPDGAPTTQAAPTATYLTTRTYTRTLVLPPQLVRRIGQDGVGVLAPYLTDPTSENVLRLADRFRRSGNDVIFTRESTQLTEEPIRIDASKVNVNLDFQMGDLYRAAFNAVYTFQNPTQEEVTARFRFPPPVGSGTLSDFRVTVNGQELTAAQLTGGTQWEGTLAPGQTVAARVTYRHVGARGWNYALAGRREPVRNFDLSVHTNRPAKFQRYSLFPTGQTRDLAGNSTLRWQLPDALTAQDVAVAFSGSSTRETVVKLYTFAPLALLLGAALAVMTARLRRVFLAPRAAALAVLGVVVGLTLGGVLMSYLLFPLAGLIGGMVAALLALRALGRAYLWPVLVAALAPLAFLTGGNAGLILTLGAVVSLLLFMGPRGRPTPG
ncbi:hypothetical protein [Deinococcus maricopensis]|uniref:Uncharacterized protein n=1 Tax=Deinococcus maricopensis (strain DSM 21211 / LMG 22137 / NRRL B-23946 / LB-34) TaxID=709986 RepID=E8UBA3_DEIML|nr:hypothetical protein [Deinococcus maricopensis]ADV68342.1 hypothetical protein Deima_2712 [Deinococcus maricopensis DSM 21211]